MDGARRTFLLEAFRNQKPPYALRRRTPIPSPKPTGVPLSGLSLRSCESRRSRCRGGAAAIYFVLRDLREAVVLAVFACTSVLIAVIQGSAPSRCSKACATSPCPGKRPGRWPRSSVRQCQLVRITPIPSCRNIRMRDPVRRLTPACISGTKMNEDTKRANASGAIHGPICISCNRAPRPEWHFTVEAPSHSRRSDRPRRQSSRPRSPDRREIGNIRTYRSPCERSDVRAG